MKKRDRLAQWLKSSFLMPQLRGFKLNLPHQRKKCHPSLKNKNTMSKEQSLEGRVNEIVDNNEYDIHFYGGGRRRLVADIVEFCTELATTSNDVGYNMGIDAAIKVLQVVIAVHPRIEPQLNIAIKNLNELKYPINTNTNDSKVQ